MLSRSKDTILRLLLLALFAGYYGNITFFSHGHIINGVTIVHSHYFHNDHGEPSDKPQHAHNSNELTLIAHCASFYALFNATPKLEIAWHSIETNTQDYPVISLPEIIINTSHLRGPPADTSYC